MTRNLLAGTFLLTIPGTIALTHERVRASAAQECQVQGVWNLVSATFRGKPYPWPGKQQKMVAKNHYMWLEMDNRRDTIPLKTALDSARHFSMSAGAGRYTVSGNIYSEQLEYFPDPGMIGRVVKAKCRVAGNRWYHTYSTYELDPKAPGARKTDSTTEVYIRVE